MKKATSPERSHETLCYTTADKMIGCDYATDHYSCNRLSRNGSSCTGNSLFGNDGLNYGNGQKPHHFLRLFLFGSTKSVVLKHLLPVYPLEFGTHSIHLMSHFLLITIPNQTQDALFERIAPSVGGVNFRPNFLCKIFLKIVSVAMRLKSY